MQREPALIIGSIAAVINASIGLIAVMLDWDQELTVSAVAAATAIITFVGALITRGVVYSPATYDADVDDALHALPPEVE